MKTHKLGVWEFEVDEIAGVSDIYPGPRPGRDRFEVLVNGTIIVRDDSNIEALKKEREDLLKAWKK